MWFDCRGLIAIEMMKRVEERLGQPLHEMFDLVVGSSTGALIGSIMFHLKVRTGKSCMKTGLKLHNNWFVYDYMYLKQCRIKKVSII